MENFRLLPVLLVLSIGRAAAYSYTQYDLTTHCGTDKTLYLPCSRTGSGRAGTMKFDASVEEKSSCQVLIQIAVGCGSYYDYTSLYFNVKRQRIYSGAKVTVESPLTSFSDTWYTDKTLSGDRNSYSSSVTSLSQYKSSFARTTKVRLNFEGATSSGGDITVTLDYSVLHDTMDSEDTFCSSLSGYVLDELICETGDRVNCPSSYYSSSFDSNYAYGIDQGTQSACRLGGGAIAGIVIGVLVFIVIVISIIVIMSRRRNRTIGRNVPGVTVPMTNQHTHTSSPIVMTNYPAPYPAQQPVYGNFAQPPPSYGAPYPGHPAAAMPNSGQPVD